MHPGSCSYVQQGERKGKKGPTSNPVVKQLRAAFEAVEGEYPRFTEEEKRKAIAAGGLHVIGTERHDVSTARNSSTNPLMRVSTSLFFFSSSGSSACRTRADEGLPWEDLPIKPRSPLLLLSFFRRLKNDLICRSSPAPHYCCSPPPVSCLFPLILTPFSPCIHLRGRSGRQKDLGSSPFFLSLEDNLLRVFGGERIDGLMRAFHVEDLPIESPFLNRALEDAQRKVENYYFDIRKQLFEYDQSTLEDARRKVENYYFDIRKQLFEYDQVLNSRRERFYSERRRALEIDDMEGLMLEYAQLTMDDIVNVRSGAVRCNVVKRDSVRFD
ncbi:unnamed protein product [Closterium sp. Naga37s-1]|nr:unnamed protein product [Closterium sp. Naga37s-1]